MVACVLGEACDLIEANISGSTEEDFRREFLSYWALAADEGEPVFLSTIDPKCQSQQIAVWRGKNRFGWWGESPEALRRWLPRWGAKPGRGGEYKLSDGVLIWLPKPPTPAEYPDTPNDVRVLAQQHSPEAAEALKNLAVRRVERNRRRLRSPDSARLLFWRGCGEAALAASWFEAWERPASETDFARAAFLRCCWRRGIFRVLLRQRRPSSSVPTISGYMAGTRIVDKSACVEQGWPFWDAGLWEGLSPGSWPRLASATCSWLTLRPWIGRTWDGMSWVQALWANRKRTSWRARSKRPIPT